MRRGNLLLATKMGDGGICRGKKVRMHHQFLLLRIEIFCAEILRREQRHVAAVAILLGFWRIVEAARVAAGDAAEEERVVMILPAEKLLIMIERERNAYFVAGRAKLRAFVERFEESLFVELRLGLDQLAID
jgi:hypothetical protein